MRVCLHRAILCKDPARRESKEHAGCHRWSSLRPPSGEDPMAAPFLRVPNSDEAVDNGIVQMNVLLEPGSAEGFAVFVSTFPPLGGGPPSHHHDSYDEAFYVLSGEMEFRVNDETAWVP